MMHRRSKQNTHIAILLVIFNYLFQGGFRMRMRLLASLFFVIATIILDISIPLIFKQIVNGLSKEAVSNAFFLQLLIVLYGVTWIMSKVTLQMREIILSRVINRGVRKLSIRVFDHLHTLSLRFHLSRKTGAIATILSRLQRSFADIFKELFVFFVPTVISIFVAMIILWYLYAFMYGAILFIFLSLYVAFSIKGVEWLGKAQVESNVQEERVASRIIDSLLNFETVKYFNNQAYEHERCDKALKELENSATKREVRSELVHMGQGIITGIGLLILTWLSGREVLRGSLQVGDFVLINGYLLQFFYPLSFFGIILRHVRRGFADMENALKLLDMKPDVVDNPNAIPLVADQATIEFKDVFFGYASSRSILKGISFTVPAGKTVAIVGSTGSGKSTIARLLFRSFDIDGGAILINDHDIRTITLESLHSLIGIVPQDTVLFNDSLYYNIAYGNTKASQNVVDKAIKMAHLDELIKYLPEGLATQVGERGLKLSGGEKQRVSIARALMKAPKIYIFDEATSALDTSTEREIQKNIEEISKGSTSIIIAHRLSTVVNADTIVVLEHGLVAQQGTHLELLARDGVYRRLWEQQLLD